MTSSTGPADSPADPPPPQSVRLSGLGLVLREWTDDDLPAMVHLFDDPVVNRFTPLPSPFDLAAARCYLDRAREHRVRTGRVQLAVTTDGRRPLGEVLLFHADAGDQDAELAYAVGAAYRRQRLASRAVRLVTAYAYRTWRVRHVLLRISGANAGSAAVARATGFRLTGAPAIVREGAPEGLLTWRHEPGRAAGTPDEPGTS